MSARSNGQVAHLTVRCPHWMVWCPLEQDSRQSRDSAPRALFTVRCAPDSPVHPRIEHNQGLPNRAPTAPRSLGAIKGTSWHMELHTKHSLNILQCRDSTNTQLFHYDRDLSTSLSYNSAVLFRVLFLVSCVCCCCNSSSCVCLYSSLLLCSFEIIYVRCERIQIVEIPHNGVLLR
jgi:hypothetical protein